MTADRESSRLRILLYVQHLTGVGHYVRTSEIAKALAKRHDVMLTEGGWPVPRAGLEQVAMLSLSRICRQGSELAALPGGSEIAVVLQARRQCLREAIRTFCPDVLIVEHYPFSKWALGDEVAAMAEESRASNPAVKIISSVRDIQPRTRYEAGSDETYGHEVTNRLRAHFDAVLIHGDPTFTRLEEQLLFLSAAGLRLAYTGIVSEKPIATKLDRVEATAQAAPFILVSVGGGRDHVDLLRQALRAWQWLKERGELAGWKLALRPGLGGSNNGLAEEARRAGEDINLRPFAADFLPLLQSAALSISCAGYNTCANILETRCRAVFVPDPERSDQICRASLIAARHLAEVVSPAELDRTSLAAAMLKSLAAPPPDHDIALNGAERTRELIEEIATSGSQAMRASFSPASANW